MEHAFFHPSRGVWVATSEVPSHILNGYPEGTVEVPLPPSGSHEWDGTAWVPVNSAPTAEEIRAQRNALLDASDWTQVFDAPIDRAAWAAYRQALREVPEQEGFPANVVWPNKP
jgi:hypothetical protein